MINIPKCMSTQHPDNVSTPPYAEDGVLKGEGEVQEAVDVYGLGCDEQMWDSEGKDVDRLVVSKLLSGYPDFFSKHRLGTDRFLTMRVPNPSIERGMSKMLLESLESIPSAWDVAQEFYGNIDTPPIFEIILPFTTSAEELNRLYYYYTKYVVGKGDMPLYGDYKVSDWVGEVNPRTIGVIPLIEDLDHMVIADEIVGEFLKDKDFAFQRVFLARSDPALNYGAISAELMIRIALQRLQNLQTRIGTPLYPIIGAGSSPFRGNLKPINLERAFREYPSAHTLTVQSAFKYDYDLEIVKAGITKIRDHIPSEPISIDEKRALRIIEKYSTEYRRCLRSLTPVLSKMIGLIPRRRERKLHIGLFGYSRSLEPDEEGEEAIRLPRAIEFCAILYSLGIPPELLGLAAMDSEDLAYVKEVYPSFEEDLADSLKFANEKSISRHMGKEYVALASHFSQDVNRVHEGLTTAIRGSLDTLPPSYISRYVVEAARLRKFLG